MRFDRISGRRDAWWATLALLCLLLVLPLTLTDAPPLLDYPNHMARMFVLAFGGADPFLSRMYAPHWTIIPNLALDALIPPMLAVMPLDIAGRIAVAAAILLPVSGCIALNRAVFGARSYWPLLSGLAAYNVALRLGLLNFLIGVGLALLVAAAWAAWRRTRPRCAIAIATVGAVAVFFCHIMGLALLLLLLGAGEGQALLERPRLADAARRGAALATVFALPCVLFLHAQVAGTWTAVRWPSPQARVFGVFDGFICDNLALDLAAGLACFGFVYACLRERRGVVCGWLAAAACVLAIGYAAAPEYFKGTGFFDTRFAVMLGFLLFAGFRPRKLTPRVAMLSTAVFAALFCARIGAIAADWQAHNADLAQLRATIAPVEPGSRVLVAVVAGKEAPAYWAAAPAARDIPLTFQADLHAAALLLTERRAFYPFLFTNADQQPLAVLPPYLALARPQGSPLPHSALADPPDPEAAAQFPPPPDWQREYDYLLLLDAGGEPDLARWAGTRMDLVHATDAAALFRIRKRP